MPAWGGNSEIHERIVDVLFGCLSEALPQRVAAAAGASSCNFLFGGVHPRTGEFYANYHIEGCGWGGKAASDGNDIQCPINGNCRNTPVEVFETRYPWLTHSYSLAAGSGGHGRSRGGSGSRRVIEARAPEITVSSFMDRHEQGAWGMFGGQPGSPGALRIRRHGEAAWGTFSEAFGTVSPNKFADIRVRHGDRIEIVSPGGGGYGPPAERDPELVCEEVRDGMLSARAAREVYGVVLARDAGGGWLLDATATARLRSGL